MIKSANAKIRHNCPVWIAIPKLAAGGVRQNPDPLPAIPISLVMHSFSKQLRR
jgi:hypothetical protein